MDHRVSAAATQINKVPQKIISRPATVPLCRSIGIAVSCAGDAVLVLNDLHSAGWSASLDGSPVPILLANGLVRAVRVPRGDHVVEMTFETPGFEAGFVTSGSTAVVILAGLVLGRLRRRTRAV